MQLPQLKSYNVKLHILSPIHVGTGQELDPFSYVIRNNTLYLIDLIQWMESYPKKDELHKMMDSDNFAVMRSYIADNFNLENAVQCKIPVDSSDLLKTYQHAIQKKDSRNQVLVSPMMRNDITMEAYIPGSSIKGAIRTALANQFVKEAGVRKENAFKDRKTGEADYNEKIFGNIRNDPMRWLKISDVSMGKDNTVIVEPEEYSPKPDKTLTPKGYAEVTSSLSYARKPLVYPLHVSMAEFELYGKKVDLPFLINALYDFYVSKYEQEYAKFYNSKKAEAIQRSIVLMNQAVAGLKSNETLIRIGHFSHVECVTLDEVRNPKTRKGKDGRFLPYGQTRTLANGLYPFGWAKLEFCDLSSEERPEKKWNFPITAPMPVTKNPQTPQLSAVRMTPISKPVQIRKPEPVEEKTSIDQLMAQIILIRHDDKLQLERVIQEMEELENDTDQKQAAQALKEKLEKAGTWNKHPMRKEIEIYLR